MRFKIFTVILITNFCILVSACGYQLRKPLSIDQKFQPVYISGNSALTIALKRQLIRNNVQLADSKIKSNSTMQFEDATSESHSFSVSQDGRDAEYLRRYAVLFSWYSKQTSILNPTLLRAESVQIANPDQPTAQQSESEIITTDLQNALVEQAVELINNIQR